MNQQLFKPGQTVTWSDRNETMKVVTKDLGAGPFKVHSVEDIPPEKCNCGGSSEDETHQAYAGCPYANMGYGLVRDSVGHPQLVTIDDGTGKPLTTKFSDKERVQRFSGAYFKAG